jgi:hypothetical protein
VVLRVLLGIEMIQIAEELVEAMIGRQVLIPVAEVVLAELAGRVAKGFEKLSKRWKPKRLAGVGRSGGQVKSATASWSPCWLTAPSG